jgi:hypothetical protein
MLMFLEDEHWDDEDVWDAPWPIETDVWDDPWGMGMDHIPDWFYATLAPPPGDDQF